jgi:hypothetical protein
MDRRHREAPAVIVVGQWTGQEAGALRHALRMTIMEFAERLGVAERTVAKWEVHGSAIVPVPVMQSSARHGAGARIRRCEEQIRNADEDVTPAAVCRGRGLLTRGQPGAIVDVDLAGRLFTRVATVSP